MEEDSLRVDRKLRRKVCAVFSVEIQERAKLVEKDDSDYQEARQTREHQERLLEENPLQVMFDNETDPTRRTLLERDIVTLQAMGFTLVQAQKALFLWAGVHHEAVAWLVQSLSIPDLASPWNMTQLQEYTLLRNSRRALLAHSTPLQPVSQPALRSEIFGVYAASAALAGTGGRMCWCLVTAGMHALGQSEIVVILLKEAEEDSPPQDVITFMTRLFHDARRNLTISDMSVVSLNGSRSFMGSDHNTGFIFARHCGQVLSGVSVPPAPFLFGLLLRGTELQFAQHFPARMLLLLGQQTEYDHPYPLWSDRTRPALVGPEHLQALKHMQSGLRLPGAVIVRTRSEDEGFIQLLLPAETQQQAIEFLDHWPSSSALTIIGGVARGADCHLVHVPGRPHEALLFSLPGSQGNSLGATQCILARHSFDGGMVDGDGLVMSLSPPSFQHVLQCLRLARSCEVPGIVRRGVRHLGLRVVWLPRDVVDSGVAHLLSSQPHLHPLAIAAACVPRGPATLSLPPFLPQQLDCLDLHTRLSVVGVTIVTARHLVAERVTGGALDMYVCGLVHAVSRLLGPHLDLAGEEESHDTPPSTMVLHVDVFPQAKVRFRITKDWRDAMPQAPAVTMADWRSSLHAVPVPAVVSDSVNFHMTFQIC